MRKLSEALSYVVEIGFLKAMRYTIAHDDTMKMIFMTQLYRERKL